MITDFNKKLFCALHADNFAVNNAHDGCHDVDLYQIYVPFFTIQHTNM